MSTSFESSLPSDIRLLLRADAERCWLDHEVIPVLRDVEADGQLPEEEAGAALAYLEAMWDEATLRARETDAAHSHLRSRGEERAALGDPASRYHAAVRMLRGVVAERVRPFVDRALEHGDRRDEVRDRANVRDGGACVTDARNDGARVTNVRNDGARVTNVRNDGMRVTDARPGGCAPRAA